MKSKMMFVGALSVPFLILSNLSTEAFGQELNTPEASQSGGRLVQVAPLPDPEPQDPAQQESHEKHKNLWVQLGLNGQAQDQAQQEAFSADHWLYLLSDADLDVRMSNFDKIVELARGNLEARNWLSARASDTVDPELAWTAKLALREVEHRGLKMFFGTPGAGHHSLFGPGGVGSQVFKFQPGGVSGLNSDALRIIEKLGNSGSESQRVSVTSGPNGVKVSVVKTVDGKEETSEYEGASVEELIEAHPELSDLIGGAGHGFQFGFEGNELFDLDGIQLELDRTFGNMMPLDVFKFRKPSDQKGGQLRSQIKPAQGQVRTDILGVYIFRGTDAELIENGFDPKAGVFVESVVAGTLAAQLGIATGDTLSSINGVHMENGDMIGKTLRDRADDQDLVIEGIDSGGKAWTKTWSPPVIEAK